MKDEQLNDFHIIVLAALLHDIGKFSQRAGIECGNYEHFTEDDYGKHGAHSKWSAHFIEEYLPEKYRQTASLVLYHHNPKDELTKIIETADRLSASERIQIEIGDPQKTRLLPILARIFRADWKEKGFQLKPLNINDNIMPQKPAIGDDLTNEYRELWNLFTNEVNELKNKNLTFNAYLTTLYYLLQKYTWCIPSAAYKSEPDVSLFDHLKATAAIAAGIYKSKNNEQFRLIGGDLSGIQKFIYKLSSPDEAQSGMAQRLRGRSFYISLLNESIAISVLETLELPITNLLWCGGGNFTILAHCDDDLAKIDEKINKYLQEKYQGDIILNLAWIDIDSAGIQDFCNSLNKLNSEIQKKKQKKFIILNWPNPYELASNVCVVCGKDDKDRLCSDCKNHEDIGQKIPKSRYLIRTASSNQNQTDDRIVNINFGELDLYWSLISNIKQAPDNTLAIYTINDTDLPFQKLSSNTAVGFKFLAQKVSQNNGHILTFDEMQKTSEGAKFLGALRMDVDDLGLIFAFGLGENRSLSRISALSRTIDLFFSGYLNKIAEQKYSDYILYAGGDDLFIVANWNEAIDTAKEIYQKFKEFCCDNPNVHISGGIHLFKHKFPIGISANLSKEKLEGLAKQHKNNGKEKDSLAVFEFPCFWDDALLALEFADFLKENEKDISHNFIYNILQIYKTHFKKDSIDISWVPKFRYLLKRNIPAQDQQGNPNILYTKLLDKMPTMIKTTPIWANYVLLATRKT